MREDIEEGKGKPIYYCDYCYSSLTLLQFSYGQQPREVEEKHNTLPLLLNGMNNVLSVQMGHFGSFD